jgi:hypothetical protein
MAEPIVACVSHARARPAKHVASTLACRDPMKLQPPEGSWRLVRTRTRVENLSFIIKSKSVGWRSQLNVPSSGCSTYGVYRLLRARGPFLPSAVLKAILEDLPVDIEPEIQS